MTRIKALVNVFAILAAGIAFFWAATPTLATASNCGEIVATAAPGLETAIEIPVVILGAGPGGLSVAYELSKRLPMTAVLTIDQGERPGDTWRRRMPSDFPLVTRWEHSALEGPFGNRFPNAEQVSAKDFADYLERYAHSVVPRVRTNTAVYAVSKQLDGRLRLETSTGVIIAKQVVNATGNFSKPELPQLPGRLESAIPQMHSSEYLGEEQLRALGIPIGAKQPILVVGNGTSAAQLLYALSKSGYNVALSLRTGVAGAEQSSKDLLLSNIESPLETSDQNTFARIRVALQRPKIKDVIAALPELLESGRVQILPEVDRLNNNSVQLQNGSVVAPLLVIFATGYEPVFNHLKQLIPLDAAGRPVLSDGRVPQVPNLHFIGVPKMFSNDSHLLRGIRKDAAVVAERVAKSL